MAHGPVEEALASVIRTSGGAIAPGFSSLSASAVEPSSRLGDFKIDLTPLLAPGETPTKSVCREAADHLVVLEGIEKATGIPPRIYISPSAGFLHDKVVSSISKEREAYGANRNGEGRSAIVSFSSPNANKPLHLGHLRNNFIGMALSNLAQAHGYEVKRSEVVSDWGVHICQAVLAYQKWGKGATPESAGVKGDHFVGGYYVMFHEENEKQKDAGEGWGSDDGQAEPSEATGLEQEAGALLRAMESGDEELCRLNQTLTGWAEGGIRETYSRIGSKMDLVFHEKDTLALARELIAKAVAEGECRRRADGSVFVDLAGRGLGEVTLIRRDGTPVVYATLLGFCVYRYEQHQFDRVISVFGEHWEAGVEVVDEILRRLGFEWVSRMERVHYGMVSIPEGRMRSREGTVVVADQLLDHLSTRLLKSYSGPTGAQEQEICDLLAAGLLKYLFLQARCSKNVLYEEKSLWEQTFPQFASVLKTLALAQRPAGETAGDSGEQTEPSNTSSEQWRNLLLRLNAFPRIVERTLTRLEPADLVYFLDEVCLLARACRREIVPGDPLWEATAVVIRRCLSLLNIELPGSLEHLPPPFAAEGAQTL